MLGTKKKEAKVSLRTQLRRWRKALKQHAEIFGWKHAIWDEVFGVPPLDWMRDRWYNIKHLAKRYDTVKIRDLSKWEYYDPRTRMPEAVLECVAQFVEEQFDITNSFKDKYVEWDSDDGHTNAKHELVTIYKWWSIKWRNRYKLDPLNCNDNPEAKLVMQKTKFEFEPCDFDDDGDPRYYTMDTKFSNLSDEERKIYDEIHKASREWEERMEQELEDMCIRAIKIRSYMWR